MDNLISPVFFLTNTIGDANSNSLGHIISLIKYSLSKFGSLYFSAYDNRRGLQLKGFALSRHSFISALIIGFSGLVAFT